MSVETTCIYCGVGCKLRMKVHEGEIVRTFPSTEGPGEGRLCIKGWSVHEFIHHPDRLSKPLIKEGDDFREAGWGEAIGVVADKLSDIKDRYGGESIAVLTSAKATNEENYLLQKFARAVLGTNNVDHCARLCHASTVSGLAMTFGSGAMTNSQEDIEKAKVIFLIGTNTTEQHPLISRRIIQAVKKGSQLIVADPRNIDLTEYSVIHLRHKPGTDVALLNSMMNVIYNEELHDKEFIANRTENFDSLIETIQKYSPEYSEDITQVSANKIREAARIIGKSKATATFFSMGITQHVTGVDNVVSVANLAMLTGNIGRPGTGVNPLRGQNNVQGACDMGGLPNYYPGYQQVADDSLREKFSKAWRSNCPDKPGLTLMEMTQGSGKEIKAMFIMGENPLLSDPNINHVKEQLEKLDFLVITELFMSETAEIADVVLPAASFVEKNGTFTATDRRVQLVNEVIPPLPDVWPDWKIIMEISRKMGYEMEYGSASEIMDELASLTPIYGGINYSRLRSEDLRWPCVDEDHSGTKILHVGQFSRGKGRFIPADYRPPAEETDENYPYILTTGRILAHWHTGTMTRRSPTLTDQINEAYVEINNEDASNLGIENNELVKVSSRRGTITLKAVITEGIKEGVVFIPFHFAEAAANKLTNDAFDPIAKIPELKVAAVKIQSV
jgi:formate dehydrogenase alpha subunit